MPAEDRIRRLRGHLLLSPAHCNGEERFAKPTDSVRVHCTGQTEKGFDASLFDEDQVEFVVGDNETWSAIEEAVIGMKLGEEKAFVIEPEFGEHPVPRRDESKVFDVPLSALPKDGRQIGVTLLVNAEDGQRPAMVTALNTNDDTAVLDMNDPIAGKPLHMTLKLLAFDVDVEVRPISYPSVEPAEIPEKAFTLSELNEHNGKTRESIYISLCGYVYDVTGGKHYVPGGSYEAMAGRDGSLALATYSFNWTMILDKPLPAELQRQQEKMLSFWANNFHKQYPVVGRLVDGGCAHKFVPY